MSLITYEVTSSVLAVLTLFGIISCGILAFCKSSAKDRHFQTGRWTYPTFITVMVLTAFLAVSLVVTVVAHHDPSEPRLMEPFAIVGGICVAFGIAGLTTAAVLSGQLYLKHRYDYRIGDAEYNALTKAQKRKFNAFMVFRQGGWILAYLVPIGLIFLIMMGIWSH